MKDEHRYNELRSKLPIDRYNLDEQMVEQHILYLEASERSTDASFAKDRAKDSLERTRARLYDEIAGKIEKPTDARVTNQVAQHEEHIAASLAVDESKLAYDKWVGMLEAYRQRASMMKYITELITAGYFSTNSRSTSEKPAEVTREELSANRLRRRVAT